MIKADDDTENENAGEPKKSWAAVAQQSKSVPVVGKQHHAVATKVDLPALKDVVKGRERVMIIMRGLPGSGKSTLVTKLLSDGPAFVCSADDFFVDASGEYHWDPKRIHEAHQVTQARAKKYVELGMSPIIVDNTNTMVWEARPYVENAVANGYAVEVLQPSTPWCFDPVELAKRNKHNVPEASIRKMLNRWETDFTVDRILGAGKGAGQASTKHNNGRKADSIEDALEQLSLESKK
jgi:predicted kinase